MQKVLSPKINQSCQWSEASHPVQIHAAVLGSQRGVVLGRLEPDKMAPTRIGLADLAVMGQNLALNIAEKGFPISVCNQTTSKVDETPERAKLERNLPVYGFHDPASFVNSVQKRRVIIMLVKAGSPVDQTIATLSAYMEKGDCVIDGDN
ncbi:hypothetical protein OPV22_001275 [Ensete ventricosum]|uniref:6-phosphogluconate dehydrogenase NADP-binding domain-containing protein n=1 Tax=Ensete ventricosum TaxID=4639 RepID=A0AAV8QI98_ENSVE|nr:hypothetical protein OPV22_001275 [Ensete ventricosum]